MVLHCWTLFLASLEAATLKMDWDVQPLSLAHSSLRGSRNQHLGKSKETNVLLWQYFKARMYLAENGTWQRYGVSHQTPILYSGVPTITCSQRSTYMKFESEIHGQRKLKSISKWERHSPVTGISKSLTKNSPCSPRQPMLPSILMKFRPQLTARTSNGSSSVSSFSAYTSFWR